MAESHNISMDTVRANITDFIKRSHFTLNEWCIKAGISEGTLRNFLRGRTESISLRNLLSLCEAAKIPASLLIDMQPHSIADPVTIGLAVSEKHWYHDGDINSDNVNDIDLTNIGFTSPDPFFSFDAWGVRFPRDIRFNRIHRFGAVVLDNEYDPIFPKKSLLICVGPTTVKRPPQPNDTVLCLTVRDDNNANVSVRRLTSSKSGDDLLTPVVPGVTNQADTLLPKREFRQNSWDYDKDGNLLPENESFITNYTLDDRVILLFGIVVASYTLIDTYESPPNFEYFTDNY